MVTATDTNEKKAAISRTFQSIQARAERLKNNSSMLLLYKMKGTSEEANALRETYVKTIEGKLRTYYEMIERDQNLHSLHSSIQNDNKRSNNKWMAI
eukprot:7418682-Pyramimonas_sp.AAC.1